MKKNITRHVKEGGAPTILIILVVFLVLRLGSVFHELLHGCIALINHWQLGEYTSGLMTGQTTVIATAAQAMNASTTSFWFYFMFPPIFIFAIILIATVIKPVKIIMVIGIILQYLNLASFNTEIPGSDASSAANFLTTRGWQIPEVILAVIYTGLLMAGTYLLLTKLTPDIELAQRAFFSFIAGASLTGILNYFGIITLTPTPEASANLLHLMILYIVLILWGMYLYISIEDSPKDAGARIKNIEGR